MEIGETKISRKIGKVVYYIVFLIQIISFYMIFLTVTRSKYTKIQGVLCGLGEVLVGITFSLLFNVWGAIAIGIYFLVITFFKNSHRLILWDFFSVLYALVMNTFLGYISWDGIMYIVKLIFRNTSADTQNLGYILTALAPMGINVILVYGLKKGFFKKYNKSFEALDYKLLVPGIIVMAGIMLFLYPVLNAGNYSGSITNFQSRIVYVMWALLLLSFLYVSISYYKSQQKEMDHLKEEQMKQLIEYSDQIEALYDEISGFRHDYGNLLVSLEEGIYNDDMDQVKTIYESVVKPTGSMLKREKYSFTKLRNLQIPEIKSILSAKIIMAQQKGIQVHLEVEEAIQQLYMNSIFLARAVAILMDNAIEASSMTKEKKMNIAIYEDDKNQTFFIANSFQGEVPIQEMNKKGYSTKGKNRGRGLSNIQEILSKERYVSLESRVSQEMFVQILTIKKQRG